MAVWDAVWRAVVAPVADYAFMRYGLVVAAVVGLTSAVLSCLLVVRRQALLGDAIAHAVLLGVAVGWLAARHVGIFWGALAAGVLAGLAITWIERNSRVKLDAAMGIVFTFAFALGLAIISVARPRGIDLFHVLLGNVLGVDAADLWLTVVSGGLVLGSIGLLWRGFHLWSFDPTMARAAGWPVGVLHYAFTAMLSATIVASLQAVGLILVIAMLVTPGATAYLLTDRLATMMRVAALVGLLAAVGGLYGSFHLDVASGPAMVIVASLLFFAAFLFAPRRGVAVRVVQRRRRMRRTLDEDVLKAVYRAEHEDGRPATAAQVGAGTDAGGDAVEEGVQRLLRSGLLREGDGGVLHTTDAGAEEALRVMRAHRLLESYLHDAEGVPLDQLHEEAERMEHRVGGEMLDDIDRTLGRPAVDPHGHPIPRSGGDLARIAGRALADLPLGASGRVTMVRDDREDLLREMLAAGIHPDVDVTVVGFEGGVVRVAIDDREAELGVDAAERVLVVPADAEVPEG